MLVSMSVEYSLNIILDLEGLDSQIFGFDTILDDKSNMATHPR